MSSCSRGPLFLWPLLHGPWAREDTSSFLVPRSLICSPTEVHSAERASSSSLPCNWNCRTLFCVHTDPLRPASLSEAEESCGERAPGDRAGGEVFHVGFPIGLFSNLQLIICFLFLPVLKSVFFLHFLSDQFLKNQVRVSLVTVTLPLLFYILWPGLACSIRDGHARVERSLRSCDLCSRNNSSTCRPTSTRH